MNELEVRLLIKSIKVKLGYNSHIEFTINELNQYNKKGFFNVNTKHLFVGLFFIYNTNLVKGMIDYTFNSIVSVDKKGNNITHTSFSNFIAYLMDLPEVIDVLL